MTDGGYQARWQPPRPYGWPAALDSMGTIAAPLLASVSIALIAVVLTGPSAFHLANAVLLCLVIAAAAFVATVECTVTARSYAVTPSEIEEWSPEQVDPDVLLELRREQRYYRERFRCWATAARIAYNAGILALTVGVAVAVVPSGHVADARLAVIAAAVAACVAEVVWIGYRFATRHRSPSLPEVLAEPPASLAGNGASGSS